MAKIKQKFIVTGGAGFIGSSIAKELVKRGHAVKVIDNLLSGKKENLSEIIGKTDFVEGDITDLDLLKKEFAGYDYVLHQAALVSVPESLENPMEYNRVNIGGTLNVLMAAKENNIKRVVLASSCAVYGDEPSRVKTEEITPRPLAPYSLNKYIGERYGELFSQAYGLETVALRYFNIFGPNQDPNSAYAAVIPKFIVAMIKGKRPVIFGDGEQTRDFTYIQNVVEANILAVASGKGVGEVFNIACGQSYNLNQLVREINTILKTDIKPIYQKVRFGDLKHSRASIKKARQVLKYRPSVDFKEGLAKTARWYLNTI